MSRGSVGRSIDCRAKPWVWCTYIGGENEGKETIELHSNRGYLKPATKEERQ